MPKKRQYPTGKRKQMTPRWKELVRAKMEALGKSDADMARATGVHKSAIGKMLGPNQQASALVDDFVRILGVSPPMSEVNDPLDELVHTLSPKERKKVLDFIALLRE